MNYVRFVKNKMEYQKRKPDKETESMRIWECDKDKYPKEYEESEKLNKENNIEIKYKDVTFNLYGFTKFTRKSDNQIMFAYKFKHEEKLVIVYNPSNSEIEFLMKMFRATGYEVQNVMTFLENAYNETKTKVNHIGENSK